MLHHFPPLLHSPARFPSQAGHGIHNQRGAVLPHMRSCLLHSQLGIICSARHMADRSVLPSCHIYVAGCPSCHPAMWRMAGGACVAFVLSCAGDGCQGHLCFDCVSKAVFPGNRSSQDGAHCPHCRRVVDSYSYAFFAAHTNVSALQDKLAASDAELKRLNKSLTTAKAQAEESTQRLKDWCAWAAATKAAIQAMPSSAIPPHVRASAGSQPDAETAPRSRSPRSSVRVSGVMYSEYNG